MRRGGRVRGTGASAHARYRGDPRRFRAHGFVLWLRADVGVTIATGVSSWADQSGSGNTATQGSGALQPALVLNVQYGRPVIRGDAALTTILNLAGITLGATHSIAAVGGPSSAAGDLIANGAGTTGFISGFGNSFEWFNNPDRQVLSAAATGVRTMLVTQTDGSNLAGYFDSATAAVFSVAPGVVLAGKILTKVLPSYTGDVAELVVYSTVMAAGPRQRLFGYLKATYAR